MKLLTLTKLIILSFTTILSRAYDVCENGNCIQFTLAPGTGCAWACSYCSSMLNTSNYYFTPSVCTYESGVGCVGNPLAGVQYTCCSL